MVISQMGYEASYIYISGLDEGCRVRIRAITGVERQRRKPFVVDGSPATMGGSHADHLLVGGKTVLGQVRATWPWTGTAAYQRMDKRRRERDNRQVRVTLRRAPCVVGIRRRLRVPATGRTGRGWAGLWLDRIDMARPAVRGR
ncbi:hypothetical protein Ssi02_56120 [Sinosporangium siamense]|uniref:Uncharacterized protein n=1 Tax=Sinosporangium siamense TaxID=1367973 RepID=A0A919RND4_9ACTN|nr:hypothetical protein Ssi02_56120 [Sinosporangium siamense]